MMSDNEKEFYKSMLGFCWTWLRLIVLKYTGYNVEEYEKHFN